MLLQICVAGIVESVVNELCIWCVILKVILHKVQPHNTVASLINRCSFTAQERPLVNGVYDWPTEAKSVSQAVWFNTTDIVAPHAVTLLMSNWLNYY